MIFILDKSNDSKINYFLFRYNQLWNLVLKLFNMAFEYRKDSCISRTCVYST